MENIAVSFEGIPEEVVNELVNGRKFKEVQEIAAAKRRQREIAVQTGEHRSHPVLGRPTMAIDPTVYHAWANKFKTYECWSDKGFRKYITRNFDETRVRGSGGTRVQVGYTPANTKFHKSYSDGNNAL